MHITEDLERYTLLGSGRCLFKGKPLHFFDWLYYCIKKKVIYYNVIT